MGSGMGVLRCLTPFFDVGVCAEEREEERQ